MMQKGHELRDGPMVQGVWSWEANQKIKEYVGICPGDHKRW